MARVARGAGGGARGPPEERELRALEPDASVDAGQRVRRRHRAHLGPAAPRRRRRRRARRHIRLRRSLARCSSRHRLKSFFLK